MASAKSEEPAPLPPTAEQIKNQLDRILSSQSVHLPERARKFLRFVVIETLAGRSQYLKAYTIADIVFGRQNFDAQSDPAVRIEAGRIRRELERYYLIAGPQEPVIISIPKGGYVPSFEGTSASPPEDEKAEGGAYRPLRTLDPVTRIYEGLERKGTWVSFAIAGAVTSLSIAAYLIVVTLNNQVSGTETTGLPTIAIEAFDYSPDNKDLQKLSRGTTDELISKLVAFKEIVVVDSTADTQGEAEQIAEPRYVLQGTMRLNGERIRSNVRLVRRADGAVIWANNYETDLSVQTPFEAESAIAGEVSTAIAQPFGIIFQSGPSRTDGWDAYDCALSYYGYRRKMTQETLQRAQSCLEDLTSKSVNDATSLAYLSMTYLDQVRFSYKLGAAPSLELLTKASLLAERASDADPQNARALQAVMLTSFFRNDTSRALEAGAAAYRSNPNDTEVLGEYGLSLSMSGKWQSGCDLISKAVNNNAGPRGYYEVGMALCAFMRGDFQAAELWSRMSDLDYNPMHRMLLVAILGASGKTDKAHIELAVLNTVAPTLMRNIRSEVSRRLARPEDQEKIFTALRQGGALIDPLPVQ